MCLKRFMVSWFLSASFTIYNWNVFYSYLFCDQVYLLLDGQHLDTSLGFLNDLHFLGVINICEVSSYYNGANFLTFDSIRG